MSSRTPGAAGFTMIELLIAVFVISVVVVGVFSLFVLNLRLAGEAERRVVGLALANERLAQVRNLPYVKVGTQGGVPAGSIAQSETVERNGVNYKVDTDVRYVDDPFDGTAGGGGGCVQLAHSPPGNPANCQDLCVPTSSVNAHLAHGDSTSHTCDGTPIAGPDVLNTDYKQVRVEVSWGIGTTGRPIVLLTHVAPPGFEGSEAFGTLDFLALDAEGAGVEGATVAIFNDTVDPVIDVTTLTNTEGRVVLPGLPESAESYSLSVEKAGFTSEQTYAATADFIPHPQYQHFSALVGEITVRTFLIDEAASIILQTRRDPGGPQGDVVFRLYGTKTIGVDGEGQSVYRVDLNETTDAGGDYTAGDLVWDSYDLIIDGPTSGYDIKETSQVLPLTVNPGETIETTVELVEHQDSSLWVAVVGANGQPVNDADVQLVGNGYDQDLATGVEGQVYFPEVGPGQSGGPPLPGNGDYTLNVTAAGFAPFSTTVTVSGTSRFKAELTAE